MSKSVISLHPIQCPQQSVFSILDSGTQVPFVLAGSESGVLRGYPVAALDYLVAPGETAPLEACAAAAEAALSLQVGYEFPGWPVEISKVTDDAG